VSLLERADQCMFMAKRDGRNRTVDDSRVALDVLTAVA
jgi:diguanylate cyclase